LIVAVHQPNYIPWIGFFDKMDQADIFVILDAVQHSRTSVTHRNSIKCPSGSLLLSVPLQNKGQTINQLLINKDHNWNENHWKSISYNYRRSKYWELYEDAFKQIYQSDWKYLSDLNMSIIQLVMCILKIETTIVKESTFPNDMGIGCSRIVNICKHLGATTYLSGIGAKAYNDEQQFEQNEIKLVYQEFTHPYYNQQWGPFMSHLSVLDLIFNHGPQSIDIIRNYRKSAKKSEVFYG